MSDIKHKIAIEIYKAVKALGGDVDLLAILGSYGNTLDDEEILQLLKDYNENEKIFQTVN